MPVAEPSGEYLVKCSVDLSPLFGKIEETKTIVLSRPPPGILDQRLAELRSDDINVKSLAASELGYFHKDGERVFTALAACFRSAPESLRNTIVYSMENYPEQIALRSTFFLEILGNNKYSDNLRKSAARCLSDSGPIDDAVEKALRAAAKADRKDRILAYFLAQYRNRKKAAGTGN